MVRIARLIAATFHELVYVAGYTGAALMAALAVEGLLGALT